MTRVAGAEAEVKATSPAPAPVFANFVSPFDLLDQTHKKDQLSKQASADSSPPPPASISSPAPYSSLPSHLAAAPSAASSDTEDTSLHPSVSSGAVPRHLLAIHHLPSSPVVAPSWAPVGLRLPPHPSQLPQHLTIDVTLPHLESLSLKPTQHTPITLFSIPFVPSSTTSAGVWNNGLVYKTNKTNRIRIIGRQSGTRTLLKGFEGEVLALDVARQSSSGYRYLAATATDGKLIVWRVQDKFDEKDAKWVPSALPHLFC